MANVIKHKRGSGSDPAANNLVLGELAIRTDVGKLFTKMDSGAIAEIAGGGSDIAINTLSSSSATGGGSATFNGSAYRFTLSAPPSVSAQQLLVSINGVVQKPVAGTGQPSEGFSVSGNDIILGDAPATGADFFILTFKSLGVSEPADNSVTSAKIVDGAIVTADLANDAVTSAKILNSAVSENKLGSSVVTTGKISDSAVTSAKIADGAIVNADVNASAAIAKSKLASLDIVNADVNASAAIAGTKINPNFGSQNIATTGNIGITFGSSTYQLRNDNGVFKVKETAALIDALQIATNGAITAGLNLTVSSDITSSTGDIVASAGQIRATDTIPAIFKRNVTGTNSALVLVGNNTQTYAFEASSSGFSINDYTNINVPRFSIDSSGNSKVLGDLTIQSNFPRIFLTDNDTNPDYSISNANGKYAVYDETNSADRFTIQTGGADFFVPLTINSGLFVGGTSVSSAEGGQIELTQAPNSTLAGSSIVFDTVNNGLRFFESASPFKGAFLDISQQADAVASQIMTSTTGVTYTGTMTFGSGAGIDLSSNDVYLNARVIQNSAGGTDDGLYLGYGNAGSSTNVTRVFGGGSTTHHFVYDTTNFYPGTDNHSSLGLSANRFKTLYLSDGVNFGDASGGTSYAAGNSANTLDNYEEGTWTPSYTSFTNIGTTIAAKYVKIGQVVHISFNNFQNNNNMAVNGAGAYINGLPFAVDDIQGVFIGGYLNKDVPGSYAVSDGVGNRIILGSAVSGMRHIWSSFTYRTTA